MNKYAIKTITTNIRGIDKKNGEYSIDWGEAGDFGTIEKFETLGEASAEFRKRSAEVTVEQVIEHHLVTLTADEEEDREIDSCPITDEMIETAWREAHWQDIPWTVRKIVDRVDIELTGPEYFGEYYISAYDEVISEKTSEHASEEEAVALCDRPDELAWSGTGDHILYRTQWIAFDRDGEQIAISREPSKQEMRAHYVDAATRLENE